MSTGQKPPRQWAIEARLEILKRWKDNASYLALIAACPGAGKTRCAVEIADQLLRDDIVELVLVLVPTVNIQKQWVDWFAAFGIEASCDARNESLRWRRDEGDDVSMIEDKHALVITYAQLSRDPKLFAELVRRHPALLIGDEVHHADDDEKYGEAIGLLKDGIVHSLALSGTPFNTGGGSLALCDSHEVINQETGKPERVTKAAYTYDYGTAITDEVCRQVEFAKVSGHGKVTYRSLTDHSVFQKLVSTSRKSDPIGAMLDPQGEYVHEMIREGLRALTTMREAGDKRAAMLFVCKSVSHGNDLIETIQRIKLEKPEWAQFSNIQEIYNDTDKAHARIKGLVEDSTDIVVSVRMISEGVDIQRLRVGVYLTDWVTRMFFIQFVGRFIRYEVRPPLDQSQYAVVVVPAHPEVLRWALEIEHMILASQIKLAMDEGGEGPERKNERIGAETFHDDTSLTHRGKEIDYEMAVIEEMYRKSAAFKNMPRAVVLQIAHDLGLAGNAGATGPATKINWSTRNDNIVKQIVRLMAANGEPDSVLYERVNGTANSHVGIRKKDKMTAEDTLIKRHTFLQDWLRRLINKVRPDLFA